MTTSPSLRTKADPSRLALMTGVTGLLAVATHTVIVAAPLGDVAGPIIASFFGPLLAAASVALYLVLAAERATLAGLLAAIANVAAGALVTAMLLVQLAVNDAEENSQRCRRRLKTRSTMSSSVSISLGTRSSPRERCSSGSRWSRIRGSAAGSA